MPDIQTRTRQAQETLKATSIAAGFTVNDLDKSIRFYTDGLGFGVEEEYTHDGQLHGVMLKAGSGRLGLSQDDFAKGRDRVKGVGMRLWIATDQDIHALADRAIAAGITLDQGPAAQPWGGTAFTVTDPDGYKLTIVNQS
jgi:catechol 2,3-dioxygenase-like lactoylglutathione lyase family enzyme